MFVSQATVTEAMARDSLASQTILPFSVTLYHRPLNKPLNKNGLFTWKISAERFRKIIQPLLWQSWRSQRIYLFTKMDRSTEEFLAAERDFSE
jgi:hypothetical protein